MLALSSKKRLTLYEYTCKYPPAFWFKSYMFPLYFRKEIFKFGQVSQLSKQAFVPIRSWCQSGCQLSALAGQSRVCVYLYSRVEWFSSFLAIFATSEMNIFWIGILQQCGTTWKVSLKITPPYCSDVHLAAAGSAWGTQWSGRVISLVSPPYLRYSCPVRSLAG